MKIISDTNDSLCVIMNQKKLSYIIPKINFVIAHVSSYVIVQSN